MRIIKPSTKFTFVAQNIKSYDSHMKTEVTRRASLVSNSFFFYKTERLRVKDEGLMTKSEGQIVKDKGQRVMADK